MIVVVSLRCCFNTFTDNERRNYRDRKFRDTPCDPSATEPGSSPNIDRESKRHLRLVRLYLRSRIASLFRVTAIFSGSRDSADRQPRRIARFLHFAATGFFPRIDLARSEITWQLPGWHRNTGSVNFYPQVTIQTWVSPSSRNYPAAMAPFSGRFFP